MLSSGRSVATGVAIIAIGAGPPGAVSSALPFAVVPAVAASVPPGVLSARTGVCVGNNASVAGASCVGPAPPECTGTEEVIHGVSSERRPPTSTPSIDCRKGFGFLGFFG
jgi:hypothetical protein